MQSASSRRLLTTLLAAALLTSAIAPAMPAADSPTAAASKKCKKKKKKKCKKKKPATPISIPAPAPVPASLSVAPTDHNFGLYITGDPIGPGYPFTVSNTGGSASGSLAVGLATANPENWAIESDACSDVALPVGGSCVVQVGFRASGTGARSATLNVSASPGGAASAQLTGTTQIGEDDE